MGILEITTLPSSALLQASGLSLTEGTWNAVPSRPRRVLREGESQPEEPGARNNEISYFRFVEAKPGESKEGKQVLDANHESNMGYGDASRIKSNLNVPLRNTFSSRVLDNFRRMNLQIRALSAVHQPDPEASEQEDGQVNSTSPPSELTTTHDEGTIKKVKTEEICDDDALQDDKSVIDDTEDMDVQSSAESTRQRAHATRPRSTTTPTRRRSGRR